MKNYHIAVIVGSLRKESINRKLATALEKLAPSGFSFKQLRIDDLPLYNQDDDAHQTESVLCFKKEIQAADGIIFVTPDKEGLFDAEGHVSEASKKFLQSWMDAYVAWVKKFK